MKRFTETDKWRDPWFRSLSAPSKLVFFYVLDNCNNAGFLEFDRELLVIFTKMKEEHLEGALKGLSRGIIEADGWLWVRRFLRHQKNESLNGDNPAHKQIISLLSEQLERFGKVPGFSDFIAPYQGLFRPIGVGIGLVKVKGRVKRGGFEKPSRAEAKAYGAEIEMKPADVDSWYDHFESNGWKVGGKAQMTDWRAALRNGKRTRHSSNGSEKSQTPLPPGHFRDAYGKVMKSS